MINKIDRGIMELQVSGEEMYQKFLRVIENANITISTYECDDMPPQTVDPTEGTVAFGAALFGWAFTLTKFARIYSEKFNISKDILTKKLWGDNYYDPEIKQWITSNASASGNKLERGFVQFIMNPIIKLVRNIMENNKPVVFKILEHLCIQLTNEEKE
jgi:elongation factor 2